MGLSVNFWRKGDPAVFGWVPAWINSQSDLEAVHQVVDATYKKIRSLNDDRLLVLVGAMFVEEQLQAVMSELITLKLDLSWAARTDVLRGLRILPERLLDAVDLIRKLRNQFAHELRIATFGDLPGNLLSDLRKKYSDDIYRGPSPAPISDADMFSNLAVAVVLQLASFRLPMGKFAEFVRSKEFMSGLKSYLGKPGAPD